MRPARVCVLYGVHSGHPKRSVSVVQPCARVPYKRMSRKCRVVPIERLLQVWMKLEYHCWWIALKWYVEKRFNSWNFEIYCIYIYYFLEIFCHTYVCVRVYVCVKKFQGNNIHVKNIRFLKIFNSYQYKLY